MPCYDSERDMKTIRAWPSLVVIRYDVLVKRRVPVCRWNGSCTEENLPGVSFLADCWIGGLAGARS
jgi:hypothetical protein